MVSSDFSQQDVLLYLEVQIVKVPFNLSSLLIQLFSKAQRSTQCVPVSLFYYFCAIAEHMMIFFVL